jgi:transcriptional regulator GlxA family with amidase domain
VEITGTFASGLSPKSRGQAFCNHIVLGLMQQLYCELHTENVARELAIDGLAMQLVAALKREQNRPFSIPPVWLNKAKEILTDTSSGQWTLSKLSRAVGVEPEEIVRVFRAHVGISPAQFYRSCRWAVSRKQLIETDEPMALIAVRAGFFDQAHFTRQFKQLTGLTPSHYRRLFGRNRNCKNTNWRGKYKTNETPRDIQISCDI